MPREGDAAAAKLQAADDAASRKVLAQSRWRRVGDEIAAIVHRDKYGLATLAGYFALSFIFFGRSLIGHFSDRYIGIGADPGQFPLFLEWWRYSLLHRVNPFHAPIVWAPSGYNFARATSVPLAGLALIPIEVAFGLIPAYNVAILLCPALAAWAAFILCRYVTRSYWPSVAGGYIFGFSPFMLGHLLGQLQLVIIFLLPLAACLVLRFLNREVGPWKFIVLFTLLLVAQFLSSLEVFATMTATGAVALLIGWWLGESELRRRILGLIPSLMISYIATAILMGPYLYYFFNGPAMASGWASVILAEPAALFLAAPTNIFGGWVVFQKLATGPPLWDAGEYVGIPLFLLFYSFARSRWKEFAPKLLAIFVILTTVATFGPALYLGRRQVPMPWVIVTHLPLGKMILPARLSVYMFLGLAIIFAMWLSERTRSFGTRIVLGSLVIISLLPNLSASFWTIPTAIPAFFKGGMYKHYLSPGENVVVLPYGYWGDSDLWQANTRMYFRMAGSYVGILPIVPESFAKYPIVHTFYNPVEIPGAAEQLKAFLVQKDVGAIIVADKGKHLWRFVSGVRIPTFKRVAFSPQTRAVMRQLFSSLGVTPIEVGGVTLYRVPLKKLQPYKRLSPRVLQERIAAIRMAKLVEAADEYVKRGLDLRKLTPYTAEQLGMLPPNWVGGIYRRQSALQNELILGSNSAETVRVGLFGPRRVLEALSSEYGRDARDVQIFPPGLYTLEPSDDGGWVMAMDFTPAGIAKAVAIAHKAEAENSAPLSQNPKS